MTDAEIGMRIVVLRTRKGMSTTELARAVDISQAQISRLENGKQGFRSSTLARIAEALDVAPVALMMEVEDYNPIDKLVDSLEREVGYPHWDKGQKEMLERALKWARKARDGKL